MSPVPFLDLRAQYAAIRGRVREALDRVVESQRLILGPEVEAFERDASAYCGCKHAIGCSSGTDALILSLRALGVGPGVDVVVPTFSFFATAGAVANCGARPVFADIEPETLCLDPDRLEAVLTARTRAVVPVHLFGQCADHARIADWAERHGVAVLEDAAQAIGATFEGGQAGTLGALGAFSFYPTKNLGACGDAGLVTTDDDGLARSVRLLAAHGGQGYRHEVVGTNSRLDSLQAAFLRVKLRRLDRWQAARRRNAALYDARFEGHPALLPPVVGQGRLHVYHQYVIQVARGDRDDLMSHLNAAGIASAVYYPLPLHLQPCFADLGGRPGDHPVAEETARRCLALPVHPSLAPEAVERVAAAVREWADRQL